MARPVGSKTKIRGSEVADVLQERGIHIVRKRLDLAEQLESQNKLSEADRVYQDLMQYIYAKRRLEDQNGNPEPGAIVFPQTKDELAQLIKICRGEK